MRLTTCLLGLLALVVLGLTLHAGAYPTPDLASKSWELTFTSAVPRPIAIRDNDGVTKWYWYMTYKVVNRTGEDQLFVPEIAVATDQGDIVTAGKDVPTHAYEQIRKQTGNTLLAGPAEIIGKILQGEDFAKESVAVWPAFTHDVAKVSVFVAGLSGETTTVKDPVSGQAVRLVKTLMLQFDMPGRSSNPQFEPMIADGSKWIMR